MVTAGERGTCIAGHGARAAISLVVLLSLAAASATTATAQRILHEWRGTPGANDEFGVWAAAVGDVDGDGIQDVGVGARRTSVGGVLVGRLYVYSGRDGRVLFTVTGQAPEIALGARFTPAMDFDCDGMADILVSTAVFTSTQIVNNWHVVSGRTQQRLATFRDYYASAVVGDVDGDVVPDILFGNLGILSRPRRIGQAVLLSGGTGASIYEYNGTYQLEGFGAVVASAGDFDGNGTPDLLIGAQGEYPLAGNNGIWTYSGRTGNLLFRSTGVAPTDSFPWALAGVGDVDGDGLDDIAVSDHGIRERGTRATVEIFAGPSGRHVHTMHDNGADLGDYVRAAGDVDGDGHCDVWATSRVNSGRLYLFAGRSGAIMFTMSGGSDGRLWLVDSVADTDGDDFPDFVAPGFASQGAPAVRLFSGAPDGITTLGTGCASSLGLEPRIGCTFVPRRGQPFSVNLSRVRSGAPAFLMLGASSTSWNQFSLPLELSPIGMPGCWLRTSPDVVAAATTVGPPGKGRASVALSIPNDPLLAGQSLFAQWFVLEPAGATHPAATTRALRITIQ